jgi:arylformamidase
MPVWPGDPGIKVERVASIGPKKNFNVSRLQLGAHTLTHVDAPYHVIDGGPTVDRLPLDALIGPAVVVEPRPQGDLITATDLGQLGIRNAERILIKTRNSELWLGGPYVFEREFVALTLDAARWLVSKGVKLVGVDYLSVETFNAPEPVVHRTLLQNGVVIVEGLNLSRVPEGRYQLICLPLKVQGADGAPARAVLAR